MFQRFSFCVQRLLFYCITVGTIYSRSCLPKGIIRMFAMGAMLLLFSVDFSSCLFLFIAMWRRVRKLFSILLSYSNQFFTNKRRWGEKYNTFHTHLLTLSIAKNS